MKRMNKKGFTLVELLAVIVILGLLMAIAIPSVTKYITQSRKKTLISSIDSYVTAVTTAVNDNEFGALSNGDVLYYIPVSNVDSNSCVSLEKGGTDPFGNWQEAYVAVNYDSENYSYDYYFTFYDDAGYGMALTKIEDISASGSMITNPSPVDKNNITTQFKGKATQILVLVSSNCKATESIPGVSKDETAPVVIEKHTSGGENTIDFKIELTGLTTEDYPLTVDYYIKESDTEYEKVGTETITSGTSIYYTYTRLRDRNSYDLKAVIRDRSGNTTEVIDSGYTFCFLAGTKVLTETGLKNIEDIKLGEKVYSLNTDTNERELKKVTGLIRSRTKETIEITIGDNVIKATPRHQFYIVDKGWIRAYELEVGDVLVSTSNGDMTISKIEHKYYEEEIPTYNLTVEDNHNYLITEDRLLVHNAQSAT